ITLAMPMAVASSQYKDRSVSMMIRGPVVLDVALREAAAAAEAGAGEVVTMAVIATAAVAKRAIAALRAGPGRRVAGVDESRCRQCRLFMMTSPLPAGESVKLRERYCTHSAAGWLTPPTG